MAKAQYGILRFAKYKGPEISNIEAHNERTKETYASNPDVDLSRSKFNFHLIEPRDKYRAQAEARIKECQCPRVCSNSVRVVETLITASPEFFEGKKREEVRAYFERALGFLQSRIAPENFISAVVHMDENTPHMHVSFVPITEDGRLSAKEIVGNKKKLTEWQDGFWQHMVEKYPDLERGKSASITGRTHIPPRLFKEAEHLDKQLRSILAIMDETNAFTAKKNIEEIRKRLKKLFPKLTKFKETLSGYEKAYKELQKKNASLTNRVGKLEADKADLSKQVKEKKLTERLAAKQLEADYQNLYRRVSQYAPELLHGVPDPQKKKELSLWKEYRPPRSLAARRGITFCPIRQQSKRKEGLAMEFKVRLFLGDELIDPSDYDKIRINCPDVDRIVNEIYERNERRPLTRAELDALDDELDGDLDEPPAAGKSSVLKKLERNQELVKQRNAMPPPKRPRHREPVL